MTQGEAQALGPVLHSFFASHLITVRGLCPASVRSYRDTVRLFLVFIAADKGSKQIPDIEIVGGRLGRSATDGSLPELLTADSVAALVPCMADGSARPHACVAVS